jgi:hypothetical protein
VTRLAEDRQTWGGIGGIVIEMASREDNAIEAILATDR